MQEHQSRFSSNKTDRILGIPNPNNIIKVVHGKLGLEAVEDKILIQLDKFKSGYECATCKGEGQLKECICVVNGTPGKNRLGGICKYCKDDGVSTYTPLQCPDCQGRGATIIIPESARTLPTSGVIVSLGPLCKHLELGQRVLFGAHTGYFVPFKGNIKIRCMREDEILCLLYNYTEDKLNMGDAIDEEAINVE